MNRYTNIYYHALSKFSFSLTLSSFPVRDKYNSVKTGQAVIIKLMEAGKSAVINKIRVSTFVRTECYKAIVKFNKYIRD